MRLFKFKTLLILVAIQLLAVFLFALLEISIEGIKPWGAGLPSQFGKQQTVWILTQYHVLKDLFILILVITGIFLGTTGTTGKIYFNWRLLMVLFSFIILIWVGEDFWWNILHPCWNWALYRLTYQTKFIRNCWIGSIPADYIAGLILIFLFHFLSGIGKKELFYQAIRNGGVTILGLIVITFFLILVTGFHTRKLEPATTKEILNLFYPQESNEIMRQLLEKGLLK